MNTQKAYLDTCIVSGLAREDLDKDEQKSLHKLLTMHKNGEIELVTSELTANELSKIPAKFRSQHQAIYYLLKNVPSSKERWADNGLPSTGAGGVTREDPLFTEISNILPGEVDAQHVFQAVKGDCDYFVTVDKRTILRHSMRLFLKANELMVMTPSDMITLLAVEI